MLTHARLLELLHYDAETGVFTWKVRRQRIAAGTVAGTPDSHGARQIKIDRVLHLAHRLAWFYVKGSWPVEIDHENRNKDDNRWSNLRHCTHSQNCFNKAMISTNTNGAKGVTLVKKTGMWNAWFMNDAKRQHIGNFVEIADAVEARRLAVEKHYGEFAGEQQ